MEQIRYSAAACQTALSNPTDRRMMKRNTDRMLSMIDSAVAGSAPFLPVRLIVFPEFAHSAPVFAAARELIEKLAVEIPNQHTEAIERKAKEYNIYHPDGLDAGGRFEMERSIVQYYLPRRALKAFFTSIERSILGSLTKFTQARTISRGMTSRCSRWLIPRSAGSVVRYVTTGSFPKR